MKNPRRKTASWRRKWKRTPIERRAAAAASLTDVVETRPDRSRALAILLLISLAAHAPVLYFARAGRGTDPTQSAAAGSYLRKVIEKHRAQAVSKDLAARVTMPPPPADPQAVVSETLTEAITTDIEKAFGKTLDVKITGLLAAKVTAGLADELAEAARNIADGRLSEDQIKALQEQFRRKAHQQSVRALGAYREKTQVEHAKMSVTEWYDSWVAPTLLAKIHFELYRREHNQIWFHTFVQYPCGAIQAWNYTDLTDFCGYGRKVRWTRSLLRGVHFDPNNEFGGRDAQYGWRVLPNWPAPSLRQAEAVLRRLTEGVDGRDYARRPWAECVAKYLTHFWPHRLKEMQTDVAKVTAAWAAAIAAAEAYVAAGKKAPAAEALLPAQAALMTRLKALNDGVHRVWAGGRMRQYVTVNRAVRSRVFRGPARQRGYNAFVDTMVSALWPAVRDMAANEFREGILIREKGVSESAEAFADAAKRLLRRTITKALPPEQFEQTVFVNAENPYKSEVTGRSSAPTAEQIAADEAAASAVLAKWPQADRTYPAAREKYIADDLAAVMKRVAETVLERLLDDGRFRRDFYRTVEGVDYTDTAAERLDARKRALAGRGQDLARLTADGVPDSSAGMAALLLGAAKGHGVTLKPVKATMRPGYIAGGRPRGAVRSGPPRYPPPPADWGRRTQPEVEPPFKTPRFEAIPFLANFPRLDGDLGDWGRIRPLTLQVPWRERDTKKPILVYAAWNYQGFFFGYRVKQAPARFAYPWEFWIDRTTGRFLQDPYRSTSGGRWTVNWPRSGDHFRLFFDTLDARKGCLGQPHTQEFFIFPQGTETCPDMPGIERIFRRPRDADPKRNPHGYPRSVWKVFGAQAPPEQGPDGTGPYRVTKVQPDGYTVEVFLPRSLLKVPVFAPGWYIGFDCLVGAGAQAEYRFHGQYWACRGNTTRTSDHNTPASQWGDLLLLGTDPRLAVQDADAAGTLSRGILPGHSYLLTVIDPDRNVHLTAEDTVLVTAEVLAGDAPGDVEAFILKETGKNTSVFRGYVDTQPGRGRQVQGVLELLAGQEVRFGYVDFANARGRRNVVYRLNLPVVAHLAAPLAAGQ